MQYALIYSDGSTCFPQNTHNYMSRVLTVFVLMSQSISITVIHTNVSHTHTRCDIESEYIPTTFTATAAATVDSSFIKIHNDWPRCEASSRDDY